MIADLGLAIVFTIMIEACLGASRSRRHRREIAEARSEAYLNGVHAANRVNVAIRAESRH